MGDERQKYNSSLRRKISLIQVQKMFALLFFHLECEFVNNHEQYPASTNPDSNPPLFFSNPNPDSCFLGLYPNPKPAQKALNPDSNLNLDSDSHITDPKP